MKEVTNENAQDDPLWINSLTVEELKNKLRTRGLRVGGIKSELLQRLADALNAEYLDAAEVEPDNSAAAEECPADLEEADI